MKKTIEIASSNSIAPYGAIIVYNDREILEYSVYDAHNNPLMHGELSVIKGLFWLINNMLGDDSESDLWNINYLSI